MSQLLALVTVRATLECHDDGLSLLACSPHVPPPPPPASIAGSGKPDGSVGAVGTLDGDDCDGSDGDGGGVACGLEGGESCFRIVTTSASGGLKSAPAIELLLEREWSLNLAPADAHGTCNNNRSKPSIATSTTATLSRKPDQGPTDLPSMPESKAIGSMCGKAAG
jgi:hypothetical protein